MPLHEVAELTDGGFVRRGFPAEVDAHEPAHRQGVVQSLLGGPVREIEPVLKEVDAQHPFDSDRPPARTLFQSLEIVRLLTSPISIGVLTNQLLILLNQRIYHDRRVLSEYVYEFL